MPNVIMRPVFDRPEMLKLSIEYEIKAREYFNVDNDSLLTLFVVEYGSPDKTKEIITNYYPYKAKFIFRNRRFGLTPNILEGMKDAFKLTDTYVIYIEDDILLHKTYFQYMSILLTHPKINRFSILSPYSPNDSGSVNEVSLDNRYGALAPLIDKAFYLKYVAPCSNEDYYNNRGTFVTNLNNKYKAHWNSRRYKFTDMATNEQAGLINRLVDVAIIEEERYVIMPKVNRQVHIGYYGKNRPGGTIPGKTFEERIENLTEIIKSSEKMYSFSATKQYNDYKTFSSKLDKWDCVLNLIGYSGTEVR